MKAISIKYEKVFPIAAYQNEKLGIEIQLEENDNPGDAFDHAKETVESWHLANQIAEESKKRLSAEQIAAMQPIRVRVAEPTTIDPPHPEEWTLEEWQIESAGSIEELASHKQNMPKSLMPRYMNKLKQLTAEIK